MNRTESAVAFLRAIRPTDGVVVVFNNDADGIASCVLVKKWLAQLGVEPYIIAQPMPPDKNLIRRIQTGLPSKIIFLDMAIDQHPAIVQKLKGVSEILIIDHHIISHDMSKQGVAHYNPRFEDPQRYQSTSYCTYKLISKLMPLDEWLWVATLGIVADYDTSHSQDLIKEAQKRWPMEIFSKIAAMIESVRVTKLMSCEQIVELINTSKSPEQLLETGDFRQAYEKIENEIAAVLLDAEASAERANDILFYKIKSSYNIKSPVSTKLSEKWPDKLIVVYERIGKYVNASVRNQSKRMSVDKLLRLAARGIRGCSAGGHEAAGGAQMLEKDWPEFKQKLVAAVEHAKK
ncbi:MAG: DHH family phosphoesterase [Candidatus Aenigmatarchaeota archaeon]